MNIDDMDLKLLRSFQVVADERSLTKAAERLGLIQPFVSNARKRLLDLLDDQLHVRGADGLHPMPVQNLPLHTPYRADILWRKRLSVTLTTMLYAPKGLKQRKRDDEHLVCLMRADHPAAAFWDLDAYLAANHLLIAPLGGLPSRYLDDWFRKQGRERRVRLISHTFGSAPALVKKSRLIATLPSRQAAMVDGDPELITRQVPADVPAFSVNMF